MKRVRFLRHCGLVEPYNDYNQLSLDQLCDLGIPKIDPDIHPDSLQRISEKLSPELLQECDIILCSPSKRTRQTAELIKDLSKKDLQIQESNTLREIRFNPALLLPTTEKAERNYLPELRTALFKGTIQRKAGVETLDDLLRRIDDFAELLDQIHHENILCITHGFYMRILQLYSMESLTNYPDITSEKLIGTPDYDFLEGFACPVDNYLHSARPASVS